MFRKVAVLALCLLAFSALFQGAMAMASLYNPYDNSAVFPPGLAESQPSFTVHRSLVIIHHCLFSLPGFSRYECTMKELVDLEFDLQKCLRDKYSLQPGSLFPGPGDPQNLLSCHAPEFNPAVLQTTWVITEQKRIQRKEQMYFGGMLEDLIRSRDVPQF